MIAATFEERTSEFMEETIAELVALENDANDDDDSRLDHAAHYLRQFNDLFVYRGGHHVAIHFKKANGEINPVRVAIITAH